MRDVLSVSQKSARNLETVYLVSTKINVSYNVT